MTKSRRQQHAEDLATRQAYAERIGDHHRVRYLWDGNRHGPMYFRTAEEAQARADEMVKRERKEIPKDFHDRQAHLMSMTVYVERFEAGRWEGVSQQECNVGVVYADDG